MATITLFGKDIEYDSSKFYGGFTGQLQYNSFNPEIELRNLAETITNKEEFLDYLKEKSKRLKRHLNADGLFDTTPEPILLEHLGLVGSSDAKRIMEREKEGIRNKISLLSRIIETLQ